MKKSTLEMMKNYLNGDNTVDLSVLRDEVNAEWERTTAKSRANTEMYNAAHDALMACAEWDKPMTVKDLWDVVKANMPNTFTPSKMRYGMLNLWQDEVEVHRPDNGGNNTYSRRT
jgi:hypothetical protein